MWPLVAWLSWPPTSLSLASRPGVWNWGQGMSSPMLALAGRDLRIAYRKQGEVLMPAMFFVLVTTLFPLGLSPQPELLRTIAPGVVWVAALLAGLIGQESLFKSDYD